MQRRTTTLTAAALSLLPMWQPLLLGILGITTATSAVVLHQGAAIAQDDSAVARIAKAITVRIEGATQGSGVIVKKDGNRYTVLTAWHVISGNRPGEELGITTPDGNIQQLDQGSIQRLGKVDMAVLTFNSLGAYEVASIGDIKEVQVDDPIHVAGFASNNTRMLRYETGELVANAEVGIDQGYQLLYDNQTFPGMSGGVLLNSAGKLVGLHGRGEKSEQASLGTNNITKTGINQGVPITYYKLFNSGDPVVISTASALTASDYLAQAAASENIKGREQTVIRLAEQSLKLEKSATGYFYIASAKSDLGYFQDSANYYTKALQLKPNYTAALNNRARSLLRTKDFKRAINDANRVIQLKPENHVSYRNRAIVRVFASDINGALTDLERSIQLQASPITFYICGDIKLNWLNDYHSAINDFNKSIQLNPKFVLSYESRAAAKTELGDYQGAISDFNIVISSYPERPDSYLGRGFALYKQGDLQNSITDFNKAIILNPSNAVSYLNRANARSGLKNFIGAISDLNKAIELDSTNPTYFQNRGAIKGMQNNLQGAYDDFSKAILLDPKNPNSNVYINRGLVKYAQKNLKGACDDWRIDASLTAARAIQFESGQRGAICNRR